METRVALIGILVSDTSSVEQLNQLLHEYGDYIIGRMGIPYKKQNISIMSIALDAPQDVISALSGKLGALYGVSTKTVMPKISD
ncbi:MAG TPA: iron-only hydrogenase system regulator [Treponemataceae bacterium]|jgi:putative iron-only hydrogenase system regulator|nr:iron-only hydrogenase system regulator [Treponemataceae bacterium]